MMKYFAYGSNLCESEIKEWVPSASPYGVAKLKNHELKFHKISKDGSAKCDAFKTGNDEDVVYGMVYEIDENEKQDLDRKEGLRHGYDEMEVVLGSDQGAVTAVMYVADSDYIDDSLKPYSWYKQLVLDGARQHGLPESYIEEHIAQVEATEDPETKSDRKKLRLC